MISGNAGSACRGYLAYPCTGHSGLEHMPSAKRPSIRSLLKDLEAAELQDLIVELCKLNPKSRQFLELHMLSSDAVSPEPVVEEAQAAIYERLYGRGQFPKLDLRGGRKVVTEYSKVLKDYPRHATELKLCYVEIGTEITKEFGDIDERFYTSMASMFERFCEDVKRYPSWYSTFALRIDDLLRDTRYIGWGYADDVHQATTALRAYIDADREVW